MTASGPFRFRNQKKSYVVKNAFGQVIRTDRLCLAAAGGGLIASPVCSLTDSKQIIRIVDVPGDPDNRFKIAVGAAGTQCLSYNVTAASGTAIRVEDCSADVKNLWSYSSGGALKLQVDAQTTSLDDPPSWAPVSLLSHPGLALSPLRGPSCLPRFCQPLLPCPLCVAVLQP